MNALQEFREKLNDTKGTWNRDPIRFATLTALFLSFRSAQLDGRIDNDRPFLQSVSALLTEQGIDPLTKQWLADNTSDDSELNKFFISAQAIVSELSESPDEIRGSLLYGFERDPHMGLLPLCETTRSMFSLWMKNESSVRIFSALSCSTIECAYRLAKDGKEVSLYFPQESSDTLVVLSDLLRLTVDKTISARLKIARVTPEVLEETDFAGGTLVLPPWNPLKGNASVRPDIALLDTVLRGQGRAAVWVPIGNLFRTTRDDTKLKKQWVDSGRLTAVVQMNSLGFTNVVSATTAVCLFCASSDSQGKTDTTFMMNVLDDMVDPAEPDWGDDILTTIEEDSFEPLGVEMSKVRSSEMAEEDFNLSPRLYIKDKEDESFEELLKTHEHLPLSQVASLVKTQSLPTVKAGSKVSRDQVTEIYVLSPRDVDQFGELSKHPTFITAVKSESVDRQTLQYGDVLLCIRGSVGVATLFDETVVPLEEQDDTFPFVANQLWTILRLKKDSPIKDPAYLLRYFQSELVQKQLDRRSSGTALKQLKNSDLANFPIILPNDDSLTGKRARFELEEIRERWAELQDLVVELRRDFLGFLPH